MRSCFDVPPVTKSLGRDAFLAGWETRNGITLHEHTLYGVHTHKEESNGIVLNDTSEDKKE
jgi:hypothetical protein